MATKSGADAQRGDTVKNLATGQTLRVIGQTNGGSLVMETGVRWERPHVVVVETAIEREVRLEEEMNADLIERYNLRGITPPSY